MSEDTIFYYLKLNNVAYVTLHEILTSKQTWVGALNFLTCSRNDKNIKNLCISRAAATLFAGTLPIIQYKSVRESSYISQYDPNEDLSENIPNKFAIVPCFIKNPSENSPWNCHKTCDLCNFKCSQNSKLKILKMSVNERVKDPCDQCNFQSTQTQYITQIYTKRIH